MSTLHADATEVLTRWRAPEARLDELRRRFLEVLHASPDAMTRANAPAHLTAGVLVLSHDLDAVLLNLHGKARRWFHFGGHCEPDDATLAGAAAREGREESGLVDLVLTEEPVHLDAHRVPFCRPHGDVEHLDVRYAARAPRTARAVVSDESLDVRWWPLEALPPIEPEMHELIALSRAALA